MRARLPLSSLELERWYVVYVKPHKEEIAQFHLQRRGFTTFFPRVLVSPPFSNHKPIVPLFPNYLFVWLQTLEEYNQVRWSPGVKYVVSIDGIPTPIDEEIITFLRQWATPAGILTPGALRDITQKNRMTHDTCLQFVETIQTCPSDGRRQARALMQLLHPTPYRGRA